VVSPHAKGSLRTDRCEAEKEMFNDGVGDGWVVRCA